MRIDITYGGQRRVFESPDGVDLVGVTVIHNGNQFSTINVDTDDLSDDPCFRRDEQVVSEERLTVVLHYYSSPKLAEAMAELCGFEGMKCTEIQSGDVTLTVWV